MLTEKELHEYFNPPYICSGWWMGHHGEPINYVGSLLPSERDEICRCEALISKITNVFVEILTRILDYYVGEKYAGGFWGRMYAFRLRSISIEDNGEAIFEVLGYRLGSSCGTITIPKRWLLRMPSDDDLAKLKGKGRDSGLEIDIKEENRISMAAVPEFIFKWTP